VSVLAKILADVRAEVQRRAREKPIESMKPFHRKKHSLIEVIQRAKYSPLIAEIKRASPSAGNLRLDVDVGELAQAMLRGGAVGLSVLTEPKYFKGDPNFLRELRKSVEAPLLRKDFIIHEYQMYETAELGADAVLLIVKMLGERLPEFLRLARELGIEALVEVTTEDEVELAISAGAKLMGINNRNLETLEVDLTRTERLAPLVPGYVTLISESGISSRADVRRMLRAGADAVLVGTALMQADDVEQKVRELVGGD
jgi:indole-3-glycerol phosphate synthase